MKIFDLDNNELSIEKSYEDKCPQCGIDYDDIYYIPNWGTHRCDQCLYNEAVKFHYIVVD